MATLLGVLLLTGLVVSNGTGVVVNTFGQAGFRFGWLLVLFMGPLLAATGGWAGFIPADSRPGWLRLIYARWVGFAANQLLPVARVGGDLIRSRIAAASMSEWPDKRAAIYASVIADKTSQVVSIAVYGLLGLGLLATRRTQVSQTTLLAAGLVGSSFFLMAGFAFYRAQREGLVSWGGRLVGRWVPKSSADLQGDAEAIHVALGDAYAGLSFPIGVVAHVVFRLGLCIEIWVLASLFGYPITLVEALIIEGTGQILRSAAFMVPGALGAQEIGFIALGELLGIPAYIGLSLSLGRRAREVSVGLPALIWWQIEEARRIARV